MILTGRGPEQHSKGVDTVHALINLMLALGKVGKPHSGYGCLTGQGNGQGGREHGQKADQLPGYRLIEVDAHREAIAKVWGVDPASLPRKGKSAFELLDSLGDGGIRGLFVMGSNVAVASPHLSRIEPKLKSLDLLVVCDAFQNETSAHAHVVLPVYQWAEEDGTMTNLEGRVIRRRVVARPPTGPRGDLDVLRELADAARLRREVRVPHHRERVRRTPPRHRRRARRLQRHHLREDRRQRRRVLAVPVRRPSRHAADVRRAVPPRRRQARSSSRSSTAPRARSRTPSTRCSSPPAATRSTTTPARRPDRSASCRTRSRSRDWNSTRGSPGDTASSPGAASRWRAAAGRSSSRRK